MPNSTVPSLALSGVPHMMSGVMYPPRQRLPTPDPRQSPSPWSYPRAHTHSLDARKRVHKMHTIAALTAATATMATTVTTANTTTKHQPSPRAQAPTTTEAAYTMHVHTHATLSRKSGPDTNLGTRRSPFIPLPPDHTTRYRREILFKKRSMASIGVRLVRINGLIYISHVAKGSRAWALGLSAGDRIEQINTTIMREPTSLSAAEVLEMIFTPEKVELTVVDSALPVEVVAAAEIIMQSENAESRASRSSARSSSSSRSSR